MAELPIIYHPISPPDKPGPFGAAQDFGGGFKAFYMEEEVTLATGGVTTTSNLVVPLGALVMGCGVRITTAITTAVNWEVGITGDTDHFIVNDANLALGYTVQNCNALDPAGAAIANGPIASTNRTVIVTCNAGVGAGKMRIGIAGFYFVPFTS
jgi:hypothetical protein